MEKRLALLDELVARLWARENKEFNETKLLTA
jgi:hypothetical protein